MTSHFSSVFLKKVRALSTLTALVQVLFQYIQDSYHRPGGFEGHSHVCLSVPGSDCGVRSSERLTAETGALVMLGRKQEGEQWTTFLGVFWEINDIAFMKIVALWNVFAKRLRVFFFFLPQQKFEKVRDSE